MSQKQDQILRETLAHCFDMQRLAETKNAGLIAFDAAMIVGISHCLLPFLSTHDSKWSTLFFLLAVGFLILSVGVATRAMFPVLKQEKILKQKKSLNLVFFGHLQKMEPSEYLNAVKKNYFESQPSEAYRLDLSKQITANARIASQKFQWFRWAAILTLIGLVSDLISMIIFLTGQ